VAYADPFGIDFGLEPDPSAMAGAIDFHARIPPRRPCYAGSDVRKARQRRSITSAPCGRSPFPYSRRRLAAADGARFRPPAPA
jgi:hypothetical protein